MSQSILEAGQGPSLFSDINTLLLSVCDCCRCSLCKIIAFWIHQAWKQSRGHACNNFNNDISVARVTITTLAMTGPRSCLWFLVWIIFYVKNCPFQYHSCDHDGHNQIMHRMNLVCLIFYEFCFPIKGHYFKLMLCLNEQISTDFQ